MSKTYLPYDPDQRLLLPAALREWRPEGHLAYFISNVVDRLDLSEITACYDQERRGYALQSPDDGEGAVFCQQAGMVKLGHVALDGAKVRANASKHKAMSCRRWWTAGIG